MKIRLVGAELFHTGGQTDRHVEDNSRFSQFCERALKLESIYKKCAQGYSTAVAYIRTF